MELEYFVKPGSDDKWHKEWVDNRITWWTEQGIPREKLEILNVPDDDLAHLFKSNC